jgi:hypothetical protein
MSKVSRGVAIMFVASLVTTAATVQQKARPAALLHPITPKIAEAARPLPLNAVRLTGGPL